MGSNDNDKRRSFSTYFLGFVVFSALAIIILTLFIGESGGGTNQVIQIGCFITAIIAMALMIITLNPGLKEAIIKHTGFFGTSTEVSFSNADGTMVTCVPSRHQPDDVTAEEEAISLELRRRLQTGFNPENCQSCLEFLKEKESVVQNSWIHTLNESRFLRGVGKIKEAEKVANYVREKYSTVRKAVGTYHEVFAWFAELAYNKSGRVDRYLLDKRMFHTEEGLRHFPEYYQLWINLFEIACLKKDAKNALFYLNKLIKIDKAIARQYFLDLKDDDREEMGRLSDRLHRKIKQLTNGGLKMKALELAKIQNWIVTIAIVLSLFALGLTTSRANKLSQHLPFDQTIKTVLFESTGSFRCEGTSVGKAKPRSYDGAKVKIIKVSSRADGTSVG